MHTFLRTKLASLIIIALALSAATQAAANESSTPSKTSALSQKSAVQARGLWIDVRTPQEFAAGHWPGAINIPVQQIQAAITRASPDKHTPLHLYCRSGQRAQVALQALKAMGYTHVINHGGYEDLLKKGER